MTSLAARLRDLARDCVKMEDLHDAAFFNGVAEILESQAKALSEWKQAAGVEAGLRREFYDRALAAEARLAEAMKVIERDMEALTEADTQIEYLHDKFKPTGSGATAIARIDIALTAARAFTNAANQHPHPAEAK